MGKYVDNSRGFCSPCKYIQGPGEIKNLKSYIDLLGSKPYVLIDSFLYDSIKDMLSGISLIIDKFGGEVCKEEFSRIENLLDGKDIDVVIGIGGGKTIDTAKVIAGKLDAATIIVPTAASTDAPTSAVSVIYKQNGEHDSEIFHKKNPDIVLVDTDIIINAPARLLVAGMGDALATYFEARACVESRTANFVGRGYKPTLAGLAIAEKCYNTLLEDGVKALISVNNKVHSEAFENVVEANTLLSGLGFESTGCAAAHGIHDALTSLDETKPYYHGEKVAFGTICLLFLENRSMEEINTVVGFCKTVGLPTTFRELGITDTSKENIMKIADIASKSFLLAAEPVVIDKETIYGAMMLANDYCTECLDCE